MPVDSADLHHEAISLHNPQAKRKPFLEPLCGCRHPRALDLPTDTDPVKYVISANLRRRHMNESQRGMVAAKIANLRDGENRVGKSADPSKTPISQEESAKKVLAGAVPEVVEMVGAGWQGKKTNLVFETDFPGQLDW